MSILPKISPNVYPLRVQSGNYFHLDMQDIGNKLIDHSEKSNHCIPYGAIPVAGRNGWARYFDGIDDYILDSYGRKILCEGTLGKWESIEIGEVTKIVGTGTKLYLNDGNTLPPKFTGKLVSDFAQYCTALINFGCHVNQFSGVLPSFADCTALINFSCSVNQFSGVLPSFAACTALIDFQCYINQFSGVLPSFANCTALQYFGCHNNQFSGVLPSFADCTALVNFSCSINQFSGYTAESFKTQKYLHICYMNNNAISNAADINQILADLRYSKDNITDRVNCVVKLEDGTNAAPTGQGITDKDYLNDNGWTVTTN